MKKNFFKYVLPSMLAFAFSGLYSVVDGLFIGRSIGDLGLAAVNFAYPLTVLIQGIGTGLGIGGAVGISIARGKREREEEHKFLGNTIILLLIACFTLTTVLLVFSAPLLRIFGAKDTTYIYAVEYIRVIILGATFQILANGLTPIIRNYGKAFLAMVSMILGFITNIVLDWLFIVKLGYGMKGAALATIIGQFVTMIPCLLFLIAKVKLMLPYHFKLLKKYIVNIVQTGLSPFGSAMAPYIVILIMNKYAFNYGGDEAVAAYAIVSYVMSFIQLLLQGIGDGSQLLMSYYYGNKEEENVLKVRNLAYKFSATVGAICLLVIVLLRKQIPVIFGASSKALPITVHILPIFALSFLLLAFLRITTSYFYATKNNGFSYILIYGEPVISFILLIFILPRIFGLNGVWFTIPSTHLLLVISGFFLLLKEKSKQAKKAILSH
ncbi:MAG: MATE family efflux transporter [Miniphocaeibacter sp.]|uniref:MATE family efflux transporter n=1 Tax=Miniphocaeibacter sp. TaxID=3100973 RepID=UPI003BAFF19E